MIKRLVIEFWLVQKFWSSVEDFVLIILISNLGATSFRWRCSKGKARSLKSRAHAI